MTHRVIALTRLWHTGEGRYVSAGTAVDLSHLGANGIDTLVKRGAVAPLNEHSDLKRVRGIGGEYATALIRAGIRGVGDLIAADAIDIADALDIGIGRVERWQAYASNSLAGEEDNGDDHSPGS